MKAQSRYQRNDEKTDFDPNLGGGRPPAWPLSFARLQATLSGYAAENPVLVAFNLLFLDGEDLRGEAIGRAPAAALAAILWPTVFAPQPRGTAGLKRRTFKLGVQGAAKGEVVYFRDITIPPFRPYRGYRELGI